MNGVYDLHVLKIMKSAKHVKAKGYNSVIAQVTEKERKFQIYKVELSK